MEDRPEGPQTGGGERADAPPPPRFDTEAAASARPAVTTSAPTHPWKRRARARILLVALAALAALVALVWYLSVRYWTTPATPIPPPSGAAEAVPAATATPTPTPSATPAATSTPTPTPDANASPAASPGAPPPAASPAGATGVLPGSLLVPVAGVRAEQLQDTFTESRSAGRAHNAIDISAPRGTPVVAAADGRIIKLFQSEAGGTTVYQLDPDNRTVYYYAHLERYADGLAEGHFARRGETIGYVGDTGNAGPGNFHLHFSVSVVSDPARWWDGENINPYPLLTSKN